MLIIYPCCRRRNRTRSAGCDAAMCIVRLLSRITCARPPPEWHLASHCANVEHPHSCVDGVSKAERRSCEFATGREAAGTGRCRMSRAKLAAAMQAKMKRAVRCRVMSVRVALQKLFLLPFLADAAVGCWPFGRLFIMPLLKLSSGVAPPEPDMYS
jgi:hypothetical protein